jgi:hypothetical protein
MNRLLLAVAAIATWAMPAAAAPVVNGFVLGPDDSTSVTLKFTNEASSTLAIKTIRLDGNTADAFALIWDGVGPSTGPDQFGQLVFDGEVSRVLTIEFFGGTSFDPGEIFTLGPMDVDGDPTPEVVRVDQLLGVEVLFTFSDNSTALYEFIDDPAPGAGLVLGHRTADVPEPGTILLLGAGAGLVLFGRRRRPA